MYDLATISQQAPVIYRTFPGPLSIGGGDGRTLNVQGDLHLHQYNTTHIHEGGETTEEVLFGLWLLLLLVVFSGAGIWIWNQDWRGLEVIMAGLCGWMVLWSAAFLTGIIARANRKEHR